MGPKDLETPSSLPHTMGMRRGGRLFFGTSLGLLLAATAAFAQTVSLARTGGVALVGLPPLLLGTPSAPAPLLASTVQSQLSAVASLPPSAAALVLAERATAGPVELAAAKIVAARIVARSPSRSEEGLEALAESAKADPALAAWFDGSLPSLGLEGLTYKKGAWRDGGSELHRLGQGEFGFVDAHRVEGTALKTVSLAANIFNTTADPRKTAAEEESVARAIAGTDAGPRYFGRAVVDGRLVSVRERVYGETMARLTEKYAFGPDERALVEEMLARLAAGGVLADDLKPQNIMIGRTLLDPRRRAYLVDGGNLLAFPEGLDHAGRLDHLRRFQVLLRARMDQHIGYVEFTKPVRLLLDEAVERSARTTRWERFKGFFLDLKFTPY